MGENKQAARKNYLVYTAIFIVLTICLYGIFILTGKSFIWQGDGLAQHFPVLEKFYTWLHQRSLTGWSWDLGRGADKLTTFSYYVLGDPFSYLIALCPKGHLEMGYNLLILLRLYVSGLAFMLFAQHRSFKPGSQLLGTLAYTFTGYSLYVSIRHPFFLLPMILFPLLAYGIDRIYREKSWVPLAVFTGLALISNFYFAYILAIGSLAYAILRYLSVRNDRQLNGWRTLGKLVGAGIVGFLLAGVLLVPSLIGVLNSTRATAQFANGYFVYPFSYYLKLPNAILTTGNPMAFWVNVGMAGLTFLGLIYVLHHFRRYLWLNIGILLLAVGSLLPEISGVMNGLTTPSERWLLLGCLVFSLALMNFTDRLGELTQGDLTTLMVGAVGWLVVIWAANGFIFSNSRHDFVTYGWLLVTLGALLVGHFYQWSTRRQLTVLLGILSLNIINNGYGYFSPNSGGASAGLTPRGVATKYQKNFYDGAESYVKARPGFGRTATSNFYYFSNEAQTNLGMNLGTHDIMSYFSIQNKAVGDFSQELSNTQFKMNKPINQADSRTTMNNLLGVRYIFARSNQRGQQAFPYHYQTIETAAGKSLKFKDKPVHHFGNNYDTILLKSKNALPLAYLQTQQLSAKQFKHLDGSNREQALTYGTLVNGSTVTGVPTTTYRSNQRTLSYQTVPDTTNALDSLAKVASFRQAGNQTDPAAIAAMQETLNQGNLDRSVSITTDKKRLTTLTKQNHATIQRNAQKNRHQLTKMVSDNQGNPVSYDLKFDHPEQTRGTELYLELDGLQAQRFTVKDKYQNARNDNIYKNQMFTGIQRLNNLRQSLWNMSDGAYVVTANTFRNMNSFSQFGQSNLSNYQKKDHVLLNLGYSATKRQHVLLTFSGVKSLSFKSAKVVAVPFGKSYDQRMHRLQQQGLQGLKVADNRVTGTTRATTASVLTTSIPYTKGWHLTVDGKTQPTTRVNVGFVGAKLLAGQHRVTLTYQTPGVKVGLLTTLVGLLVLLVTGVYRLWRWRH